MNHNSIQNKATWKCMSRSYSKRNIFGASVQGKKDTPSFLDTSRWPRTLLTEGTEGGGRQALGAGGWQKRFIESRWQYFYPMTRLLPGDKTFTRWPLVTFIQWQDYYPMTRLLSNVKTFIQWQDFYPMTKVVLGLFWACFVKNRLFSSKKHVFSKSGRFAAGPPPFCSEFRCGHF